MGDHGLSFFYPAVSTMSLDVKRYCQQLEQLVAQPSVSCALPDWDMPNKPVLELLANWLEDLGFRVQLLPLAQEGKANLVAVLGEGEGGLVFAGHSDTVPYDKDRWQTDPFQLTEKNQRLYGLGATDMKGFFPLVLEAVRPYLQTPLRAPVILLVTADEESSMNGARALAQAGIPGIKPRYAVIGEPTGLKPIRMHKGIMMEKVRVVGKSGHSSNPALGRNALETMNQVMSELLKLRSEWQLQYRNPGFAVQTPTLNLGCIHGGDGANRICAECELHFDLRTLPGMDNEEIRAAINARLQPLAEASGTDLVFSSLFEGVDAFAEDENADLVRACEALSGQRSDSVAFATEAPFLQQLGAQTLVLGPGSIDQAHQPDEFIGLDQLEPGVRILRGLIERYCL